VSVDNASNAKSQVKLTAAQEVLLGEMRRDEESMDAADDADLEEDASPLGALDAAFSSAETDSADDHDNVVDGDTGADDFMQELLLLASNYTSELDHEQTMGPNALNRHSLRSQIPVQVTYNRQPCAAHTIQLSVHAALKDRCIMGTIATVRETCKYYRKSPTASSYLANAQARVAKKALQLLLDVKTRWESTLCMLVGHDAR